MFSTPVLALGVLIVCAGVFAEAWLGYRATQEWQSSSGLLVERRAKDGIDLLMTALSRIMLRTTGAAITRPLSRIAIGRPR